MTEKEIDAFISLVQKIKDENLVMPNMPEKLWYAVHGFLVVPNVEVVMTRTGKDFLLTYRNDKYWDGWHIPGGSIGYKESVAEACIRVAKREVGLIPKFERVVIAKKWENPPFESCPLSLVCYCTVEDTPTDGKFFTEIPEGTLSNHVEFLQDIFLNSAVS